MSVLKYVLFVVFGLFAIVYYSDIAKDKDN